MSVSYPCIRCFEQCSEPCIQCSNCNRWEHITCVPMTENELKTWDNHLLNFYCHQCCYNGVNFDSIKSLERYVANSFIHSAMKQRFWVLVKSALNRRFQRTPKIHVLNQEAVEGPCYLQRFWSACASVVAMLFWSLPEILRKELYV